MKTNKSTCPDDLSPLVLKNTSKAIAPILAKLYNFSLRSSVFPDQWKLASVTAIFKKEDRTACKNYRPISLLPCLSKVFERCVFKEIFNFLHRNKLITQLQAAYSPSSSIEFQLLELYHIVAEALENRNVVNFIFCDISKAFDKVWHEGLIYKLHSIGIRGSVLKWIKSYLHNRRQRVIVNGIPSDVRELHAGVPQGSILGPLLFIIYINDIVDVVSSNIRLYADDSILFSIEDNSALTAEKLNADLEKITAWAKQWLITFNPTKTENLLISRKPNMPQTPVYFDNIRVKEVQMHKHLGVIIQSNLKWNNHLDSIISKSSRRVDILRGLRFKLDRKSLETLYTAYVRPILEYASSVWSNCTAAQKQELENVQLSAMRAITGGIRGTSSAKLYTETNFESTYDRRERSNLVIFYKIYHGLTPLYLRNLLPPRIRETTHYSLRSGNNLSTIVTNTTTFSTSFIPFYTRMWNLLSTESKYIGNLFEFKRSLIKTNARTPKYYYTGDRFSQIIHTRMRMGCSPLKHDLYMMYIVQDNACSCGHLIENCHHFFFECPLYNHIRDVFNAIDASIDHSVTNFLFGSKKATVAQNKVLFSVVTEFIRESKRFQ